MAKPRYQAEDRTRVEDRSTGMMAVAESKQSLAKMFEGFGRATERVAAPMLARKGQQDAEAEANAARKEGRAPKTKAAEGTYYGDAYSRTVLQAHRAATSADITTTLDRLEDEAGNDDALYGATVAGAREGLLKNVDPALRPELETEFDMQAESRRTRVLARKRKVATETALAERAQAADVFRSASIKAARDGNLDELVMHRDKYLATIKEGTRSPENPNGLIDPQQAAALIKDFDRAVDVEAVVGGFERVLQGEGVDKANALLDKIESGEEQRLTDLDPEQRDRVIGRLNAMVAREYADQSRKEASANAQRIAREREVRERWGQAKNALEAGFEVEGLEDLVRDSAGTELEFEVRQGAMLARQGARFSMMPPVQRAAWLAKRENELRGRQVNPTEVAQLQAFQKLDANLTTELNQDALGLAVRQRLVDPLPELEFQDPAKLNAALQARVEASRIASAHYGREVPPITTEEATTLAAAFGAADAAGRTALLQSLASGFGPRLVDAMEVLHKEGHKTLAFVGGLATESPNTAREVLLGLDLREADKGLIPKDADARPELATLRASYLDSGPVVDAVMALYARKSQVASDTSGDFDRERFQDAVDEVTGGLLELDTKAGTSSFPAPARGVTQDQFDDWVDDGLTGEYLQKQGGVAGVAPDEAAELIRTRGRLVSIGRGEWLVSLTSARDGQQSYLVQPNGEPLVLRWPK